MLRCQCRDVSRAAHGDNKERDDDEVDALSCTIGLVVVHHGTSKLRIARCQRQRAPSSRPREAAATDRGAKSDGRCEFMALGWALRSHLGTTFFVVARERLRVGCIDRCVYQWHMWDACNELGGA